MMNPLSISLFFVLLISQVDGKCFSIFLKRPGKTESMEAMCCPEKTTFSYDGGVSGIAEGVVWPCMSEAFEDGGVYVRAGSGSNNTLLVLSIFSIGVACLTLSVFALYYVMRTLPAEREAAYEYMGRRSPRRNFPIGLGYIPDEPESFSNYAAPTPAPRRPYVLDAQEVTFRHYSATSSSGVYERLPNNLSAGPSFQSAQNETSDGARSRSASE